MTEQLESSMGRRELGSDLSGELKVYLPPLTRYPRMVQKGGKMIDSFVYSDSPVQCHVPRAQSGDLRLGNLGSDSGSVSQAMMMRISELQLKTDLIAYLFWCLSSSAFFYPPRS